jgi:hypothetical protein
LTCKAQSADVAKATASICNAAGRKKKETKIIWPSRTGYNWGLVLLRAETLCVSAFLLLWSVEARLIASTGNLRKSAPQNPHFYEHVFGFETIAYAGPETGMKDRASYLLQQGKIRLVLTTSLVPNVMASNYYLPLMATTSLRSTLH